MKYTVFASDNKLICFDDDEQVKEYCIQKDNDYLDAYYKEQGLEYENMTPVEIGYTYAGIGAEKGGCRIYYTKDVIQMMQKCEVDPELIEEVRELLDNRRREGEIDCPSYLEDILTQMTPMDVSEMVDAPYTCNNLNNSNDHGMMFGV